MVRLSLFAVLATAIASVTAQTSACQCLFQDGSHCCVTLKTQDCQLECMNVGRKGVKCNANGKFSNVSWLTGVGRTKCDSFK
ncbi:hypothetical protein NXS19_012941 [Fusarium pseudograminearum]|uniref:Extracellular membrane protein CFEM domain-containing protein n=1 Tax=Fusarium pseudograminearum (strain CS3096) TaxID=1028729 RepID=K3V7Z0_FUSPC|nr:hypothetical protein FPSE_10547 [Fusarium pseudograminearum CS3096]EKJ69294.1 hypothetical protein FPSE_10547 [Fusarium pseudograminearum CS3096]KAF0638599.1 hypothetical protein FPSE5266_10547 [Fusarium pseudograminearum]UZP45129.1 hypothetical protein NXS19_012941 [Fusarium pseudograminearum]